MTPRQPGLLSPQDQQISDRAVQAAEEADQELRDRAHRLAREQAPSTAERPFYYAAFLYRRLEYSHLREPGAAEVERWAGTLRDIHERYLGAIAERQNGGGDAVG